MCCGVKTGKGRDCLLFMFSFRDSKMLDYISGRSMFIQGIHSQKRVLILSDNTSMQFTILKALSADT